MLTKEYMQRLNEDQLVAEVLIPLLKAMGYSDVTKYHGGVTEQGKDIVCWKANDLGIRRNLAVVAKAVPITARANMGSGAMGEVLTQVQQALGKPFIDKTTAEACVVHECWVMTNQKISKDASDSISSALASNPQMQHHVTYIDGDLIWDLIEKFLPVKAVFQKLNEVSKVLGEVDSNYFPRVTLDADKTNVVIVPKDPKAPDIKPLNFQAHFVFPDNDEGQAARKVFEESIRTGVPATIPATFVQSIDLPEPLTKLFGAVGPNTVNFVLGAAFNPNPLVIRLEIHCDDGDGFIFNYVELRVAQAGMEEITLTNNEQPIPFKMTLTLNKNNGLGQFTLSPAFKEPLAANQALDGYKLQRCLSKPFDSKIIILDTDIELCHVRQSTGIVQVPEPQLLTMLDDLASMQRRIGVPIYLPSRDLTPDELGIIAKLRTFMHVKELDTTWSHFSVSMLPEGVQQVLSYFADGRLGVWRLEHDEVVDLFGTQIPLGRIRTTGYDAKLANEMQVREALYMAATSNKTPIECQFLPEEPARAKVEYFVGQSEESGQSVSFNGATGEESAQGLPNT